MLKKNPKSIRPYRVRLISYCIMCYQVVLAPLLLGILVSLILHKDDLFTGALILCLMLLPVTVLCLIIDVFAGKKLADFTEDGMLVSKETEVSGILNPQNKEVKVFIKYEDVVGVSYHPTESLRYNLCKSQQSSVWVTYKTGLGTDTCVLRCSVTTRTARDFARRIVKEVQKKTGNVITVERDREIVFRVAGLVLFEVLVCLTCIIT